jgi:LacI family transcriptional regulator
VMGFDDIELASFVTPALSTVSQPVYEFGSKAVDLLIRMFDGEIGTAEVLEPKLEIRESTAPPGC